MTARITNNLEASIRVSHEGHGNAAVQQNQQQKSASQESIAAIATPVKGRTCLLYVLWNTAKDSSTLAGQHTGK